MSYRHRPRPSRSPFSISPSYTTDLMSRGAIAPSLSSPPRRRRGRLVAPRVGLPFGLLEVQVVGAPPSGQIRIAGGGERGNGRGGRAGHRRARRGVGERTAGHRGVAVAERRCPWRPSSCPSCRSRPNAPLGSVGAGRWAASFAARAALFSSALWGGYWARSDSNVTLPCPTGARPREWDRPRPPAPSLGARARFLRPPGFHHRLGLRGQLRHPPFAAAAPRLPCALPRLLLLP